MNEVEMYCLERGEGIIMDSIELQKQFLAAMRQAGFEPHCAIIADGKLHRFRDWLDKPGRLNGWYVLYQDFPPAGAFGCWKRGIRETWTGTGTYCSLLMSQRFARIRDLLADKFEKGRQMAMTNWTESIMANGKHRYLKMKRVHSHGIRYYKGALLVPVMDVAGQIHGLQRIYHNGSKRFTYGTDKVGHFFLIGIPCNNFLCIAEGYATAATIHEITGHAVAVAFDAGNLQPVAEVLRISYPDHHLLLCADDDKWEERKPGLTKARAAAESVGGLVVWPKFTDALSRGTDFNDLYIEEGEEAVRSCFFLSGGYQHVSHQ